MSDPDQVRSGSGNTVRLRRSAACLVLTVGSTLALSPARARPTDDPQGWIRRFGQAVLTAKADAIMAVLVEISDPRLKSERLRMDVEAGLKATEMQTPAYVDQFDRRDLGTFAMRISFAVRYTTDFLFYRVILERDAKGWQLVQLNIDGSLENILNKPWPS